jgi:hypothetical protein
LILKKLFEDWWFEDWSLVGFSSRGIMIRVYLRAALFKMNNLDKVFWHLNDSVSCEGFFRQPWRLKLNLVSSCEYRALYIRRHATFAASIKIKTFLQLRHEIPVFVRHISPSRKFDPQMLSSPEKVSLLSRVRETAFSLAFFAVALLAMVGWVYWLSSIVLKITLWCFSWRSRERKFAVINSVAQGCTFFLVDGTSFGVGNHDVVTTREWNYLGQQWDTTMLPILVLLLIFAAGFGLGYATRARRSHRRRARHLMYSPYAAGSRATTFGHARRAFWGLTAVHRTRVPRRIARRFGSKGELFVAGVRGEEQMIPGRLAITF